MFRTPSDRLSALTTPLPETGCLVFLGRWDRYGYGVFEVRGISTRKAHRVAWALAGGTLRRNLDLDHLCGVAACVNPDHLSPVTRSVNDRRRYLVERAAGFKQQRDDLGRYCGPAIRADEAFAVDLL